MKSKFLKLIYAEDWNIGFCEYSAGDLIKNRCLPSIKWMKHKFKDNVFADPFIYSIKDNIIIVFAEQFVKGPSKGILVELHIDKKSYEVINKYELLKLKTHLSYPLIIRNYGKIFVCPENSESGEWKAYEYDETSHSLKESFLLCGEPLVDATPFKFEGKEWLVATIAPDTGKECFLYRKNGREYKKLYSYPIVNDLRCSRMGGNFFEYQNELYRPAQNCSRTYGGALSIMKLNKCNDEYKEEYQFTLYPVSFKYSLGLHTLNFYEDICVIDGKGYVHPICGRILASFYYLYNFLRDLL